MRYPVTSPASIIACPRHGLAVALGEDGRIISACPSCAAVARLAELKLAAAVDAREIAQLEHAARQGEAVSPNGRAEASVGG